MSYNLGDCIQKQNSYLHALKLIQCIDQFTLFMTWHLGIKHQIQNTESISDIIFSFATKIWQVSISQFP